MKALLRPKAVPLILFSLLIMPLLYASITDSIFSLFGIASLYPFVIIGILLLISLAVVDAFFKTALVRYGIVFLTLFAVMAFASVYVTSNKEAKTERLGWQVSEKIKDYKQIKGHFPTALNDTFFDNVERNTSFGYPFVYERHWNEKGEEYFSLHFSASNGMDAYLYSTKREWIYVD